MIKNATRIIPLILLISSFFVFSIKPAEAVNNSNIQNGYYLKVTNGSKLYKFEKVVNNEETELFAGSFTNNFVYPTNVNDISLSYNPNFIFRYLNIERFFIKQTDFPFVTCGNIYNYNLSNYNIDCGYFIPSPTPTGAINVTVSVDGFKDLDIVKTPELNKFLQQNTYITIFFLAMIVCLLLFQIFVNYFKRK